jgi:hypothetical protein
MNFSKFIFMMVGILLFVLLELKTDNHVLTMHGGWIHSL